VDPEFPQMKHWQNTLRAIQKATKPLSFLKTFFGLDDARNKRSNRLATDDMPWLINLCSTGIRLAPE
jgi:hypothetical protein